MKRRGTILILSFSLLMLATAIWVWAGDTEPAETAPPGRSEPGAFAKPSEEELRARLTRMQYNVTQKEGTEPPFRNALWDHKEDGIYVDIVSGEALFSSREKYRSGTGWPSFWAPLDKKNIVEKKDRKLLMARTEVRSKDADSHLGHLFNDGPEPTGLRYCINSASLRFVPAEKLEEEGYSEYLELFDLAGEPSSRP